MKFEKKQLDDHQVEIIVETDADQFKKSKGKAARAISTESKIPGFRPGKAPYDVVKRIYGEELIEERALELIINEIYPDVIKQAEIKPYGPGKLEEIIEKDPPKFKLIIPLDPSVELADYKTIKFPYDLPKIGEKDIEAVLKNLQTSYATAEEVERKSEAGDLISIKMNAVLTKPDKDQDPQILKDTPHQVIIGEDSEGEQFPFNGFSQKLIGLAKDDKKEFSYKFPKDSNYEKLQGKEVNFSIQVDNVKNLIKPELNDEFAKMLGLEDLKTLKESIQAQLETEKRNEYDNQYYNDLLEKLVEKSTINYPPLALDDEVADVLKNFEQNLAGQNLDLDTYLKINNREKEEFIEKDIKPAAQKRLEHALVLDEISRNEEIKLDQADLQKEYERSIRQIQSAPDYRKLQKQFTTQKLSNAMIMQAATRLMNQRTLERIKAYANGEEIDSDKKSGDDSKETDDQESETVKAEVKESKKEEKKENKEEKTDD